MIAKKFYILKQSNARVNFQRRLKAEMAWLRIKALTNETEFLLFDLN